MADKINHKADRRAVAMTSSTAFKTLGVPIEGHLFILDSEVPDDDLTLLSRITVPQLKKFFDMTASGEDPEKIDFGTGPLSVRTSVVVGG